ncbi:MAG: hypothetical protein FJ335_07110 [Sphingomonadales bacterium]|nr:hypothetical protein [Sphingomonadales bacterium]
MIESRIVKVMLAALPTEHARKFLDQIGKGNVLGAAWSAMRAVAAGAGGLHFAFARYRSGQEIVAATVKPACVAHGKGTIADAATCLGFSDDLLDKSDRIAGKVEPIAFLALMRSIATACVDLPYVGDVSSIQDSRDTRAKECGGIGFRPKPRPYRIVAGELQAPLGGTTPP